MIARLTILAVLLSACAARAEPVKPPAKEVAAKQQPGPKAKKKPKKQPAPVAVKEDDPEHEPEETEPPEEVLEVIEGLAVWYGEDWHGKETASGEKFDMHKLTAAHRTLPLGSKVRVTNNRNGNQVIVRINDRGPYGKNRKRIIDLSEAAAKQLDYLNAGWTEVTIEVLSKPPPKAKKKKKKR